MAKILLKYKALNLFGNSVTYKFFFFNYHLPSSLIRSSDYALFFTTENFFPYFTFVMTCFAIHLVIQESSCGSWEYNIEDKMPICFPYFWMPACGIPDGYKHLLSFQLSEILAMCIIPQRNIAIPMFYFSCVTYYLFSSPKFVK